MRRSNTAKSETEGRQAAAGASELATIRAREELIEALTAEERRLHHLLGGCKLSETEVEAAISDLPAIREELFVERYGARFADKMARLFAAPPRTEAAV